MPQSIDTLRLFDSLKKSFTEEQAHLLSHVLSMVRDKTADEAWVTKKDIKELELKIVETKRDLEVSIAEVKRDLEVNIAEVKKDLEVNIVEVKRDLEVNIAETKTLIAQSKTEILKWMVGFLLAQTGVIAALVKLL